MWPSATNNILITLTGTQQVIRKINCCNLQLLRRTVRQFFLCWWIYELSNTCNLIKTSKQLVDHSDLDWILQATCSLRFSALKSTLQNDKSRCCFLVPKWTVSFSLERKFTKPMGPKNSTWLQQHQWCLAKQLSRDLSVELFSLATVPSWTFVLLFHNLPRNSPLKFSQSFTFSCVWNHVSTSVISRQLSEAFVCTSQIAACSDNFVVDSSGGNAREQAI